MYASSASIQRKTVSPQDAVEIIYDAGGIPVIAHPHDLDIAESLIKEASIAGIKNIICWDFAIINLVLKYGLNPCISTQMSVANSSSIEFLYKNFGIRRFVLARECTLEEIASIKKSLKEQLKDESDNIEIEVFAHGAMCVSFSGRCLL